MTVRWNLWRQKRRSGKRRERKGRRWVKEEEEAGPQLLLGRGGEGRVTRGTVGVSRVGGVQGRGEGASDPGGSVRVEGSGSASPDERASRGTVTWPTSLGVSSIGYREREGSVVPKILDKREFRPFAHVPVENLRSWSMLKSKVPPDGRLDWLSKVYYDQTTEQRKIRHFGR